MAQTTKGGLKMNHPEKIEVWHNNKAGEIKAIELDDGEFTIYWGFDNVKSIYTYKLKED